MRPDDVRRLIEQGEDEDDKEKFVFGANEFSGWLEALMLDESGEDFDIESIETYEEAGLLTSDEGLVVTLTNGHGFNLTIQEF